MREVKYRAWDKEDKVMRLVQSINYASDGFAGTVRVELVGKPHACVHGESCVLLQYTGNKDSKDIEICEGDIVRCVDEPWGDEWVDEVRIVNGCIMFGNVLAHRAFESNQFVNVIGNIYTDQKLLNK